jgi:hypothetical protein
LLQLLSGAADHFGSYITLHLSSAAINSPGIELHCAGSR